MRSRERATEHEELVERGPPREGLTLMVEQAARDLRLTERAKSDIVRGQIIQFSEILKIKLRKRLFQTRLEAAALWTELEQSGGRFFVPDKVRQVPWNNEDFGLGTASPVTGPAGLASKGSALVTTAGLSSAYGGIRRAGSAMWWLTQSTFTRAGLGLGTVVLVTSAAMLRRAIIDAQTLKFVALTALGWQAIDLKLKAQRLVADLNALVAFYETGEDELENERVVREISEQISIRHINQVSKLSKVGQSVLATVAVDRIFRHLSRYDASFDDESPIWYMRGLQHARWWLSATWQRFSRPADRVRPKARLSLGERCIRALSSESLDIDDRILELDALHESPGKSPWTAAGVLSRTAVLVLDQGETFVHSGTDLGLYGVAYGSMDEVRWRKLRPLGEASGKGKGKSAPKAKL
mmetsp:Transcript_21500/g.68535  ORF Transcript_21500/g.68535 Transcript_21500/m.68535 type:complete len:411 (-) Transcript_21500:7-1239(-)